MAVALASIAVPASAVTGTTRWVDGDGHAGPAGCDSSRDAFKKIQKAIDASDDADTVVVCPGTYNEQLSIEGDRDGLTLRSSTPYGAIVRTPATMDALFGYTSLITIDRVDGVTVRGFLMHQRTSAPCEPADVMILVVGSQRANIRGNRLLSPGAGRPGQVCYAAYGVLVIDQLSGSARRTSATIGFNELRDLFVGVIAIGNTKAVTVDIVHDSIRFYWGAPPAGPVKPRVDTDGAAAILLAGHVGGTIRDNVIQGSIKAPAGSNSSGYAFGMEIVTGGGRSLVIQDNLIRRVLYGLFLVDQADTTVRRNTVRNAYVGLYVIASPGNTIARNDVRAKLLGILVDSSSTGNSVRGNTFTGNGGICEDDSSGGGSHGTANTWTDNTATVSDSPNGICPQP